MHLRRILFFLLPALLVGALVLWSGSPDRSGRTYRSLSALNSAQKADRYLPIGFFGDGWPATIVDVDTHLDTITFARRDGSKHSYQGFDGYRLKVVHLEGREHKEIIIVFRSEESAAATENGDGDEGTVRRM